MGCNLSKKSKNSSAGLKDTAIILASQTSFTVNEVEALYILYKKLSSSIVDDGLIHREELQLALLGSSRRNNLFVDRVFHLFDVKQNGVIEFEEFVRSLNIFHPKTPQAYKVAFAFDLYDLRHTGYIERQELKQMVMAILEESNLSLSDDHVKVILDKTFIEADSKGDGRIDHEEWNEFVNKNPSLIKNMTLPYLKDVSTGFPSFLISTEVQDSDITVEKDGVATTEKDHGGEDRRR